MADGKQTYRGGQKLVLRRTCLCFPVKTLHSARPPIPDLSLNDAVIWKKNADDEVVFANKCLRLFVDVFVGVKKKDIKPKY